MVTLYEHIEEMGKRAGYKNMTDLCTAANVSRSVMSELRSGRSKDLSKPNGMKFAATLNVPLDSIYNLETTEKPATNEGSGLSEEAIKIAKAFEVATPELRKVVETALSLNLKASADYEKIKVTCPIDQTEQVIYQPVYRVGGRTLPERTNNGCDNCHKCKECDICRQSVAASLLLGADTK